MQDLDHRLALPRTREVIGSFQGITTRNVISAMKVTGCMMLRERVSLGQNIYKELVNLCLRVLVALRTFSEVYFLSVAVCDPYSSISVQPGSIAAFDLLALALFHLESPQEISVTCLRLMNYTIQSPGFGLRNMTRIRHLDVANSFSLRPEACCLASMIATVLAPCVFCYCFFRVINHVCSICQRKLPPVESFC